MMMALLSDGEAARKDGEAARARRVLQEFRSGKYGVPPGPWP
jgi:hypothetical protein